MKKSYLALAGLGAAALVAEVAIHGYYDVMYKETIPQGLMKRVANKMSAEDMKIFNEHTRKSCEWIDEQDIEEIDMQSKRGYNLKGYYLPAENESNKFVVFAHGYRSDHLGDPANHERFYHEQGYNFLSIDHVTAGKSGGDWLGFDYFESDDMLSWVDYLVDRFGNDIEIILHGASMGGATVCKCASRVQEQVKIIISDCAYTGANEQFTSVANGAGIKRAAPAILKAFNALNKRLAGFDLAETDVRDSVKNSKVPMLFVHGGSDDFVPTKMCYELYDECGNEKDILIVPEAKHAQSIMIDPDAYRSKITEFASKYM